MSCAMSQVKDTRPSILASNVSDVTLMSLMCCDHLTEVFASHRNSWHRGNGGNWGLASSPLSLRHPASMAPFDTSRAYGEDRSGQRAANGTLWYHISRLRQENAAFRC